jgi:RNA polymerase sigma-70 factor, ECF subfamily
MGRDVTARTETAQLHAQHWHHVHRMLPRYGIFDRQDVEDVSQEVWITVQCRLHTYDESVHHSPRAWITGIVRRKAANHRRARGRAAGALGTPESAAELLRAPGLNPEEAAVLWGMIEALPNEDQREALLLQAEGLSIAEIAAIQGVSEETVHKRLRMAKDRLRGDGRRKSGAFLGFGSIEGLFEALRPKEEIPDEVGQQEWQRIDEAIRQQEGSPASNDAPSLPASPVPALPVMDPVTPALIALGEAKLAAMLFAAFLTGAGAGAGGVRGWDAWRTECEPPVLETAAVTCSSAAPAAEAAAESLREPPASTAVSARTAQPPVTPFRSEAPKGASFTVAASVALEATRSKRLLAQIDRAVEQQRLDGVLALVEQHARRFGALHEREREAARDRAAKEMERRSTMLGPPAGVAGTK